ncbi:Vegetative incompatibility protein HET-E-1 OS=Podospora anserina GN=HET-E1 PE=4 SV=1 [Rhizoctonia solani AG-1 IB]|uniref:Vegetative incompatibility protein HET-E-1 n=1 Tax=Thanatephorus cucumeris (strain AG1-IB / isolate 7/3/14) TaxID=1108050 RepID=A0A0B7FKE3_THACB|nr:Vegetative incompatibility protein HET-E-1 OS=Podospora anserina GN=HET-E1 PE=4 SV=1 [Rhizoctonia solani AG-1 IB]
MPSGLVIVVDALDECSNTEGVGMILDMLFRRATSLPLKFFVTSRPEPSVHSRVLAQPDKTRLLLILHEIESSLVRADIEVYLREELSSDNVSETQLKQLAELSGNLFIYAATAIRYIRRTGGGIDHRRLGIILGASAGASRQYAEVDLLYASILADAIDNPRLEVVERTQIQFILWAVVCMREPVTVKALAELTGTEPVDAETALTPLFSVLHVSEATGTVSTLHASFPDFIFDQARSDRFHCNELEINQTIAQHCFGIMDRQLRFNLCGLESSFKCDDEAEGLTARVSKAISPTLSYVIGHWGDHLVRSPAAESLQIMLHRFLSTGLLFWMEALNLRGILSVGINTLLKLKQWLTVVSSAPDLVKSLDDCWLFLTRFAASSIAKSTPHIYISALAFCHHTSSVYKNYWPRTRRLPTLYGSAIEQSQTALLATWNMHSETLSLAFSSDGSRLAVGFSDGTVSILDAHTGVPVLGPLREHTDYVRSVALSPDGSLLASCSDDSKVIVRDAYTGARMYDALKGHESWVTSVCFSPDGRNVLSGSRDHTTRIWDSRTGKAIPNSAKHHPHPVSYAAYSPDGKLIACGLDSDECPMIIYSASTGQPISGGFDAHQSSVEFVTFSPDEKNVVTGHASGEVCVWSVQDGVLTHGPLKAHKGSIRSVSFSPAGNNLVTASYDRSVFVWNAHNGYADPCLLGTHQDRVYSALFSPDGTRILSCSLDRTVKVWNTLHPITRDNAPWKTPSKAVCSVTALQYSGHKPVMSSPPPKKRSIRASIAHRLTKFASFKSPNDTQGTRDEPSGAAPRATSPVPSVSSLPPGSPNDSSSGAMTTGTCTTTLTPDPVETSALDYLANALRVLSQSAAMFPPLQAAVQGLIMCVDAMNPSSKNRVDYKEMAANLAAMSTSLSRHLQESKSTRMSECVERVSISVKEQANIIASKQGRGVGHYLAQAHKDQDEIMNAYRRIESLFRQLQCDVTLSVWNTIDEQLANTRIEALSPSKLAAYNSILSVEVRRRACANNTRTQLLREINDWSHDPDAPNIYWMNGMAGTGKTTVAYTSVCGAHRH